MILIDWSLVADRVFGESDSTEHIYNELIAPVIHKAMEGINGQHWLLLANRFNR